MVEFFLSKLPVGDKHFWKISKRIRNKTRAIDKLVIDNREVCDDKRRIPCFCPQHILFFLNIIYLLNCYFLYLAFKIITGPIVLKIFHKIIV